MKTIAAHAAALILLLGASFPRASNSQYDSTSTTQDPELRDSKCNFVLSGAARPILAEREVLHFRRCVFAATTAHIDPEAQFEFVEMAGQTWALNSDYSRERRDLAPGGKSTLEMRVRCRKCGSDTLAGDSLTGRRRRSLSVGRGRRGAIASDFVSGLLECLTDESLYPGYPNHMDYEAFQGLVSVEYSCAAVTSDEHALHDSIALRPPNRKYPVQRMTCTTTFENTQAAILTEPEMAHFDHCWIDSWNAYHSNDPLEERLMVDSVILEQKPEAEILELGEKGSRRLLSGRNVVVSRKDFCRNCRHDIDQMLSFDGFHRAMREEGIDNGRGRRRTGTLTVDDLLEFDQFLCECLTHGVDNVTLAAFASDMQCQSRCTRPIVTVMAFGETQAVQKQKFQEKKLERQAKFDSYIAAEEEALAAMQARIQKEKEYFVTEEENEDKRFFTYQQKEAQAFVEQEAQFCTKLLVSKNCDNITIIDPIEVIRSNMDYVDVRFTQNFNIRPDGECAGDTATADASSALDFLLKYDIWGDDKPESCRGMSQVECGSTFQLKAQCIDSYAIFKFFLPRDRLLPANEEIVENTDIGAGSNAEIITYGGQNISSIETGLQSSFWDKKRPAWGKDTWGGKKYKGWGPHSVNGAGSYEEIYGGRVRHRNLRALNTAAGEVTFGNCNDSYDDAVAGGNTCFAKLSVDCACVMALVADEAMATAP